jgi:hypothetical protein
MELYIHAFSTAAVDGVCTQLHNPAAIMWYPLSRMPGELRGRPGRLRTLVKSIALAGCGGTSLPYRV